MALKLLTRKDAPVENKEMGILVRFGRLMPEHITTMQGLLQAGTTRQAAYTSMAMFALREVVSELTVKGETYDPLALGYTLDTKDADNQTFLVGISAIIIQELLLSDDAKKKQSAPLEHTGAASDA